MKMENKLSVGSRILEERKRLNLSQEKLAAMCEAFGAGKTSRQSIRNYEQGKNSPSVMVLAAMSAAGFDMAYLFSGQRKVSPMLDSRESALLDNYRASEERGKSAIEMTASVLAEQTVEVKKKA